MNAGIFLKKYLVVGMPLLTALISGFGVYCLIPKSSKKIILTEPVSVCSEKMNILRLHDHRYTYPILLSDIPTENPELDPLKEKINQVIAQAKSSGEIKDISVYFRDLNNGSWFEINGEKVYQPASLIKVILMISILKQAEYNPGLLDKKIYFAKHFDRSLPQNIQDISLQENKYYSIRELLTYMIRYSDNDAMSLIVNNIDEKMFNKIFIDLGIPQPPSLFDPRAALYSMNIIDYAKFFRMLFNSVYLETESCEFALELLANCTYHDGLLKDINPQIQVAHKFGERIMTGEQQLHEVGIFYASPDPYLLGVMSSGNDLKKLSPVLSRISQIVYEESGKLR